MNDTNMAYMYKYTRSGADRLYARIKNNGSTTDDYITTTDTDFNIRITRQGGTVTLFYDLEQDNSWSQLHQGLNMNRSDFVVVLFLLETVNDDAERRCEFDDFKMTTGSHEYDTNGNWTSGNFTLPAERRIKSWNVNLTNGDSENYANISFLQNGIEKARYDNITSNTTIIESSLTNGSWNNITGDFQVKLELNGNGSSSPIIHRMYGRAGTPPSANQTIPPPSFPPGHPALSPPRPATPVEQQKISREP